MAQKQTNIYRANVTWCGEKSHYYYYARNKDLVKQDVLSRFREAEDRSGPTPTVEVIQVGTFKYTIAEPVVRFDAKETAQIENHYFKEMMRNELAKQKIREFAAGVPGQR